MEKIKKIQVFNFTNPFQFKRSHITIWIYNFKYKVAAIVSSKKNCKKPKSGLKFLFFGVQICSMYLISYNKNFNNITPALVKYSIFFNQYAFLVTQDVGATKRYRK